MDYLEEKEFQFQWSIRDIFYYRDFKVPSVRSPELAIRCYEPTFWYLFLSFEHQGTDCIINCTLKRDSEKDELNEVFVNLKISLVRKDGISFSEWTVPKTCINRSKELAVQLGQNLSKMDFGFDNELILKVVLKVSVDPLSSKNWNDHAGLRRLRFDIAKLCFHQNFMSKRFTASPQGAREYTRSAHSSVLHARWPLFPQLEDSLRNLEELARNEDWEEEHLWKERFQLLLDIIANRKACLDGLEQGSQFFETYKNSQINEISNCLTSKVCDMLLDYLYSGNAIVNDSNILKDVIRASRFFELPGLVNKYQNFPFFLSAITEISSECLVLKWKADDLVRWKAANYEPIVEIMTLPTSENIHVNFNFYLEIQQFLRVSVVLVSACNEFPIRCSFFLCNSDLGEPELFEESRHWIFPYKVCELPVRIPKSDLSQKSFKLEVTFYHGPKHSVELSKLYLSAKSEPRPRSLHLLSQDFSRLFRTKAETDTTILCPGWTFEAHRHILAARSDWFLDNLGENLSSSSNISISVPEEMHVMEKVLSYIYSGTIELKHFVDVDKLREAADKYRLEYLKAECEKLMNVQRVI